MKSLSEKFNEISIDGKSSNSADIDSAVKITVDDLVQIVVDNTKDKLVESAILKDLSNKSLQKKILVDMDIQDDEKSEDKKKKLLDNLKLKAKALVIKLKEWGGYTGKLALYLLPQILIYWYGGAACSILAERFATDVSNMYWGTSILAWVGITLPGARHAAAWGLQNGPQILVDLYQTICNITNKTSSRVNAKADSEDLIQLRSDIQSECMIEIEKIKQAFESELRIRDNRIKSLENRTVEFKPTPQVLVLANREAAQVGKPVYTKPASTQTHSVKKAKKLKID